MHGNDAIITMDRPNAASVLPWKPWAMNPPNADPTNIPAPSRARTRENSSKVKIVPVHPVGSGGPAHLEMHPLQVIMPCI